ncbi:zinc finger MYM-type protein 1-like, partial [Aphis craccivora]
LEILTFINDNKLQDTIPNLWVALKIMMTIPVTTASYERSFSKLKLIKTYLRSTMTEERLNDLALISIENEIVSKLNLNEAIQNFADLKSRKKWRLSKNCPGRQNTLGRP